MSYWEKRKEHDMYEAMKSAEETSQEIAEIYARASRELNYQISKIYERYRDKYDMTDEEALRLLNAMKDPADINELKMKLQGLEGEAAKEILKEFESPAYRARIKRLENLQDEIDRKMKEVYKQEKKISTDHYIDQYQQSYYREIFDTKKMTGLDFSFSKVDPKRLDKVLHSNWSGANYSKRIWNNTEELAEDLKKEISLAYLTGKAERDIAHDIALKYATGASNARRLVRTESAYISGQAQAAADEECGIDKYRIVATLDLRTSKICQEMDGKEFAYKDMKVGENYPPFHPYCRTTVISVLDDQDLDVLQRRARDPETGKNKTFPASMTYKEWYAQEVEGKGVGQSTDNAPQEPKKPEVSEETRQQMAERRKQRAAERAAKQASVPTNKQGQEIEFDLPANIADEDRRKRAIARNEKIKELITNMANEYDTNLTKVKRGAEKAAGEVDLAGVMGLSDSHPETVLHEFAHSMASTDRIKVELADDKEKEFMKELKKIRKRYEDARAKDPKISISAYSHHSLDEFYAEAFSHAKMKQLGLDKPWGYGDDYTFSDEVLELTDKYFKKEGKNTKGIIPNRKMDETHAPRTVKEQMSAAKEIDTELSALDLPESAWSGAIKRISNSDYNGSGFDKTLQLRENASDTTIAHELLHQRSVAKYDEMTYLQNYVMEEGSVEFLAREYSLFNGGKPADADLYTEPLYLINKYCKLYKTDYEFAQELFKQELPKRYQWLHNKITKSSATEKQKQEIFDSLMAGGYYNDGQII